MSDPRYGAVGWADAGILLPYTVWKHFGDASELAGHYDSMVRYADWLIRSNGPTAYGWGDWLAFHRTGFGWPLYPYASDPDTFAFLVHAYRIMDFRALSEMAAKLGNSSDVVLRPQPDERIRTVEADYRTTKGVIHVRSHYGDDGKWTYDYKLPPGTSATLILPGKAPVRIRQD